MSVVDAAREAAFGNCRGATVQARQRVHEMIPTAVNSKTRDVISGTHMMGQHAMCEGQLDGQERGTSAYCALVAKDA